MAIVAFLLLTLACAAVIVYPLLPGRAPQPAPVSVTDSDIDRAVGQIRQSRAASGRTCAACGRAYQPGDRFCIGCGADLPQPAADADGADATGPACPECSAALREGDQFCAKCGHSLVAGEAA